MPSAEISERFGQWLAHECGVPAGAGVVAGISGGLDSMVLLHLLSESNVRLEVVHVNYGLRDEESDADEALVTQTCRRMGLSCRIISPQPDWADQRRGESLQEIARDIRYNTFQDRARQTGFGFVAVGHHLDDQVETILLRMIRGTGIRGMAAMPPSRPISYGSSIRLVRPLLFATRSELEAYANRLKIPYRLDRSNEDFRYDRAKIRHAVVRPLTEAFGQEALRGIARSASQSNAVFNSVVKDRIADDLKRLRVDDEILALDVDGLLTLDSGWRKLLLLEATRRWAPDAPNRASTADRLDDLLTTQTGKRLVVGSAEVWRDHNQLVFTSSARTDGVNQAWEVEVLAGTPVVTDRGILTIEGPHELQRGSEIASGNSGADRFREVADASILSGTVTVGTWRDGERFQPLGMHGHKTVAEFLADRRVPAHKKPEQLVVRSGGGIVWVVGHRLAHPYRVTAETNRAVTLKFEPAETASNHTDEPESSI